MTASVTFGRRLKESLEIKLFQLALWIANPHRMVFLSCLSENTRICTPVLGIMMRAMTTTIRVCIKVGSYSVRSEGHNLDVVISVNDVLKAVSKIKPNKN